MAHWEEMSMPEFEAARDKQHPVLLPVGSLEEHGPPGISGRLISSQ